MNGLEGLVSGSQKEELTGVEKAQRTALLNMFDGFNDKIEHQIREAVKAKLKKLKAKGIESIEKSLLRYRKDLTDDPRNEKKTHERLLNEMAGTLDDFEANVRSSSMLPFKKP